jgi:hypothetical protein
METKTKKNKKESNDASWKELVHGFVGNMLAEVGDNVSKRVHEWSTNFKRRAIGGVFMLLGLTYFLTGLSDYVSSLLGKNLPGLGAGAVGIAVILIGYSLSRK